MSYHRGSQPLGHVPIGGLDGLEGPRKSKIQQALFKSVQLPFYNIIIRLLSEFLPVLGPHTR